MAAIDIISIEPSFASYVKQENGEITFEHAVSRDEFVNQFPIGDLTGIINISYEPARNLFHVLDVEYNLVVAEDPEDNAFLGYIHTNFELIKSWFHQKFDAITAASETVNEPPSVPVLGE